MPGFFIWNQHKRLQLESYKIPKKINQLSRCEFIYDKKVYAQGPKIVAIGGGTGLNAVLRGLK